MMISLVLLMVLTSASICSTITPVNVSPVIKAKIAIKTSMSVKRTKFLPAKPIQFASTLLDHILATAAAAPATKSKKTNALTSTNAKKI